MARYIDCEKACAEIDKGDLLVGNNAEFAKEIIYRTPAADVVEVVRCKDCKYFISSVCRHDLAMNLSREDDFCSYGERKD